LQAGVSIIFNDFWYSTLRYRYFGGRPLIEDGSQTSGSTGIVNLKVGYQREKVRVSLDVLNMTNRNDHDIDYFYESRLFGELSGASDIHFHPIEPRTFRLSLGYKF
jgi:outer membrane receptor protein involved in Fe transport